MINTLLLKKMTDEGFNYTTFSRHANMNPATIKRALETGDGKLSVYAEIASALGCKIVHSLEDK